MKSGSKAEKEKTNSVFNSHNIFVTLIGGLMFLNLANYSYLPENAPVFYLLFGAFSILGYSGLKNHQVGTISNNILLTFSGFSLAVIASRAFVNTAEIATPQATGEIGSLAIKQIWISGLHIHHYWLGFLILPASIYSLRNRFMTSKAFVAAGAGIGLIADELGIIIAGHTYHSPLSYAGVLASQIALLTSAYYFKNK